MSIAIGIIGGSGLYDMAELTDREERRLETPFGEPSAPYVIGTLRGKRVAFLARHGHGHRLTPSELNFRANIFGLKTLGIEYILSASAVGSLKEKYSPLDLVIPDQFVDRTRGRISTFFGNGLVAHIGFAHPFCKQLSDIAYTAAGSTPATITKGGTYVCMEGPQFSTLAESLLYRSWGMVMIGMTAVKEAKLAREAELCFMVMALVTDYDCWHPDHDQVTVEMIIANLTQNRTRRSKSSPTRSTSCPSNETCECASALKYAIITRPDAVPADVPPPHSHPSSANICFVEVRYKGAR